MTMTVLTVCGDAGGAAAVVPVVERLLRDGRTLVRAALYRQATEVWRRRRLAFELMREDLAEQDLVNLGRSADVLLLGTSVNGVDYEQRLMALAGARAVAVLDFWSNYDARFHLHGGTRVQPRRICVMDAQARDEMVLAGFGADSVVVTGQPAFDDLATWRTWWTDTDSLHVREQLGIHADERLVLFASQPITELYSDKRLAASHPGYDQHGVLRCLVEALERVAAVRGCRIVLVVRPHPREDAQRLSAYTRDEGKVRVVISALGEARAVVAAADLVCGMTSMMLVESCYLGQVTVSLQPGLRGQDLLPSNRLGWSRLVVRHEDMAGTLETALLDESARTATRQRLEAIRPDGGAAERVAAEVYAMTDKRDR